MDSKEELKRECKSTRALFMLGVSLLLGSGYFLSSNILIAVTYNKAEATVLSVQEVKSSGTGSQSSSYIPRLKYKTEKGQSIATQTLVASSQYDYSRGDKVTVFYSPSEPYKFKISSFWTMWFLPIGGFILGMFILKAAMSLRKDLLAKGIS